MTGGETSEYQRHGIVTNERSTIWRGIDVKGTNRMSAISVGIVQARSALQRVVTIEHIGKALVRWSVVIILAWIGGMKFTGYEAMGIQPLVPTARC